MHIHTECKYSIYIAQIAQIAKIAKIAKETKFCVILLFFVQARSQSSVGVEGSRGTQNARNKPIYIPC